MSSLAKDCINEAADIEPRRRPERALGGWALGAGVLGAEASPKRVPRRVFGRVFERAASVDLSGRGPVVRSALLVMAALVAVLSGVAIVWAFAPGLFGGLGAGELLAVVGLIVLPTVTLVALSRDRAGLRGGGVSGGGVSGGVVRWRLAAEEGATEEVGGDQAGAGATCKQAGTLEDWPEDGGGGGLSFDRWSECAARNVRVSGAARAGARVEPRRVIHEPGYVPEPARQRA